MGRFGAPVIMIFPLDLNIFVIIAGIGCILAIFRI
jgi:hypothetical protein